MLLGTVFLSGPRPNLSIETRKKSPVLAVIFEGSIVIWGQKYLLKPNITKKAQIYWKSQSQLTVPMYPSKITAEIWLIF